MMSRFLITAFTAFVLMMPVAAHAQFRDAIDDSDMKLMDEDWNKLVEKDLMHVVLEWDNPETGRHGSQEVLKNYKNDAGNACKTVRYTRGNKKSRIDYTYVMNRCQNENGEWIFQ